MEHPGRQGIPDEQCLHTLRELPRCALRTRQEPQQHVNTRAGGLAWPCLAFVENTRIIPLSPVSFVHQRLPGAAWPPLTPRGGAVCPLLLPPRESGGELRTVPLLLSGASKDSPLDALPCPALPSLWVTVSHLILPPLGVLFVCWDSNSQNPSQSSWWSFGLEVLRDVDLGGAAVSCRH